MGPSASRHEDEWRANSSRHVRAQRCNNSPQPERATTGYYRSYHERSAVSVAFALAAHERCGAGSPARLLSPELFRFILANAQLVFSFKCPRCETVCTSRCGTCHAVYKLCACGDQQDLKLPKCCYCSTTASEAASTPVF
eukprot:TRINITY_DN5493_c0_g1_i1.p2 TRINITY_DN5493_c0_g1~~TRINITY_DN5493_c0_g1_i1.p2  ORF type:complete len:140 (-),score=28.61 TRINITY_DN5493_c0_g1_i1:875-1294(-)